MMGEPLPGAFPRVGGSQSLRPEGAEPLGSIVRNGMKFRGGAFGDNTLPGPVPVSCWRTANQARARRMWELLWGLVRSVRK